MNQQVFRPMNVAVIVMAALLVLGACAYPPLPVQDSSQQPVADGAAEEDAGAGDIVEDVVDVGNGIVGTIARPAGEGPYPAVLMLHGFASTRDEVGGMYQRAAAALAAEGIASLRIDFLGGGDSEGDFADTTIQGQVADAEVALDYLLSQEFVDPSSVGILGFSLGGGIAQIVAGAHADELTSMVVWSTVGDLVADFTDSLGQEMFDEAEAKGSAFQDLGWRTITLNQAFFESLAGYDMAEELSKYDGPFMAIAGGEDPLSVFAESFSELASGPSEALIIPGADHIYHVLTDDQTDAETVINATATRFAETLK